MYRITFHVPQYPFHNQSQHYVGICYSLQDSVIRYGIQKSKQPLDGSEELLFYGSLVPSSGHLKFGLPVLIIFMGVYLIIKIRKIELNVCFWNVLSWSGRKQWSKILISGFQCFFSFQNIVCHSHK